MVKLLILFGPPNGGKGTLLTELVESFHGVKSIGTGDICREEKALNTPRYREAKEYMEATESTLWPTELLMEAFEERFKKIVLEKGVIVLDGFLRISDQVEYLLRLVQTYSIQEIVLIDVVSSDHVCIERARSRKREDDENIHVRLKDYREHSIPARDLLISSAIVDVQRIIYHGGQSDFHMPLYRRRFINGLGQIYELHKKSHAEIAAERNQKR